MRSRGSLTCVTIIAIAAAILAAIIAYIIYTNQNEPFKRFNIADGNCARQYPSIVDYYSSRYPFYPESSYYQPLETPTTVSLDSRVDTPLYTAQQ